MASLPLLFLTLLLPQTNAILKPQNLSSAAQFLGPHNAARSSLGQPPLSWDPHVAQYAERYARQRAQDCRMVHSDGPYGENIFWGSGSGWTASQAVAAWVSERQWYRHGTNSCAPGKVCGHYTQVVWRSTIRVGCAMVTCGAPRGGVFVVCSYHPPGNYLGEKPYR